MSVLLDKSNENIRAAALLIDQHNCYTSSVRCSYYSVFQRSVHILKYKFGMTDREIEFDAAFGNTGRDSHNKTVAALYEKIDKASERQRALTYRRQMGELKGKRVRADYSGEAVDETFSRDAHSQAQIIQQLLEHVFPTS